MYHDVRDAAADVLGGGKHEKPKKEIKEIRVRKGKSGGHVIEHHHTHPEHHPMEEHVTKGDDEMVAHMMQNIGTPNPGEEAAEQGTGAGAEGVNPATQAAALGTPGA